jgi:hypothetical protein
MSRLRQQAELALARNDGPAAKHLAAQVNLDGIGKLPAYFISSSAAIVSTPSHKFCRRRFSLAAC